MSTEELILTKLGVLNIRDMHVNTEINYITSKLKQFHNAYKDDFQGCSEILVIVNGDIANKGLAGEYELARIFLDGISRNLSQRYSGIPIKFILVPGNHDCNFALDTQVRRNALTNIRYDTLGEDSSVIDSCLAVQADFWEFFKSYGELPSNKLYYRTTIEVANKRVCFHCFNTAWMSQINEKPGSLFFPVKIIKELKQDNSADVNIAVFHHPVSWLNPNTSDNNKKEFQDTLDAISSLQIVGHEHNNELRKTENLDKPDSQILCMMGELFQDLNDVSKSGFQTIQLDLKTNNLHLYRYHWDSTFYNRYPEKSLMLENKLRRPFELSSAFISKLQDMELPIFFEGTEAKLSDIFIYHDLEPMNPKHNDGMDEYIDAETLTETEQGNTCVLEGECQIGKSSLLFALLLKYYDFGYYPILLKGASISSKNLEKSVQQAFSEQYDTNNTVYEKFRQLPKDKKILFVDDLHSCKLNKAARRDFAKCVHDMFGIIFITLDIAYSMLPECQSTFKNLCAYSIKPLGYAKRNLLVEKYLRNKMRNIVNSDDLFERTKDMFDKLCHVLGDKLIPPYPVFILTILQSLEYTPLKTNETSFGYCYQTLIHLALHRVGIPNDHIDSYINFSTELAYAIFKENDTSIAEEALDKFYATYKSKYWAPEYTKIKENLVASKLLRYEYGKYEFSYVYVFYFLAAKKIAETIDTPEGKRIVKGLFDNLHDERVANTLVFITHHTKNDAFIQESLHHARLPFDGVQPITLQGNCRYYSLLQEIVQEIKQEVLELKDPTQERIRLLEEQDKSERNRISTQQDSQNNDESAQFRPFLHAFRSIEIVGQIIKNRKGSIEISLIKNMITELYLTGFRMISDIGDRIRKDKDDLARRIEEKVNKHDQNDDIERKVYRFLQFISLQACLAIFTKFVIHIGVKELRSLFNEVALEINTPAAQLVSFSINSYYGNINIKELENLASSFRGNVVALQILKSRVRSYLYNNHVDYKLKQKIGACLNMIVPPALGLKNRGH